MTLSKSWSCLRGAADIAGRDIARRAAATARHGIVDHEAYMDLTRG